MVRICLSLFVTGLIMGSGPCLASCGPILLSYIAGTKRTIGSSLRAWLIFSLSRVFVYALLGLLAGIIGARLFKIFYWERVGYVIWFISGIFILLLGVLIFLGKESHFKVCRVMNKSLLQKDFKSLSALGMLIGFFPCVPLIGVFSYITMVSTNSYHGLIMSLAFGGGTLISPLFFLVAFAGAIPRLRILQEEKSLRIFQQVSGVILFFLGGHILLKVIIGYINAK